MSLKIVSFNIGMGATRDEANSMYLLSLTETIPYLISFIKDKLLTSINEKAVICLQEVDFNMARSGNKNFLSGLKNSLGPEWDYYYYDPSNENNQKYGIGIITNLQGTLPDDRPKEQKWRLYYSESEEARGAIAIKLTLNGKFIWVVNTHVGFINPQSQIQNLLNRVYTFDPIVPVAICGDFNIPDIEYTHGTRGQNHSLYQQTLRVLENNGFFKSDIQDGSAQTFHSWNSQANGEVVDYVMTSYPYPRNVIRELQCYKHVYSKTPLFTKNSREYYSSDHNAVVMEYDFPP